MSYKKIIILVFIAAVLFASVMFIIKEQPFSSTEDLSDEKIAKKQEQTDKSEKEELDHEHEQGIEEHEH